eukprot:PhM_4_TR6214/c0_g1_i1/m.26359/K00461/ALOX5; arachidonate 5-lipoxygenase
MLTSIWSGCLGYARNSVSSSHLPFKKFSTTSQQQQQQQRTGGKEGESLVPEVTALPSHDPKPDVRARETTACAHLYAPCARFDALLPPVSHNISRVDKDKHIKASALGLKDAMSVNGVQTPAAGYTTLMEIDLYIAQCGVKTSVTSQRWMQDAELSRQYLRGVDIAVLVDTPRHAHILDVLRSAEHEATVIGLIDSHGSVAEAMEAKRLFCVSYRGLSPEGRHSVCQKCLEASSRRLILSDIFAVFYMNSRSELLPICIHFEDVLYSPNDNSYAWLYAKSVLRHVTVVRNVLVRPLAFRMSFGASVASAAHSTMSVRHPLRQLLAPYLLNTLSSFHEAAKENFDVLATLYPNTCGSDHPSALVRLAGEELRSMHFPSMFNFVTDVRSRGMDDPAVKDLEYTYADDAMLLWGAIEKYVRSVITHYYQTPQDVSGDGEVAAFVRALRAICPSIPVVREYTLEPLVTTIMGLVWCLTALPAVWRGDLDEVLRYVPNMPLVARSLRLRVDDVDYLTEEDVLRALPQPADMARQIILTDALVAAQEESYRLNSHVRVFRDPAAQAMYTRFLDDLHKASELLWMRAGENGLANMNQALLPENIAIANP